MHQDIYMRLQFILKFWDTTRLQYSTKNHYKIKAETGISTSKGCGSPWTVSWHLNIKINNWTDQIAYIRGRRICDHRQLCALCHNKNMNCPVLINLVTRTFWATIKIFQNTKSIVWVDATHRLPIMNRNQSYQTKVQLSAKWAELYLSRVLVSPKFTNLFSPWAGLAHRL